jgi:tripartite-type tricarboxylate transporter receptor subunit TctC
VAFWDETLPKVVEAPEWKAFLDDNDLSSSYLRSRDFAKYLEGEYRMIRAVMSDLGLLK